MSKYKSVAIVFFITSALSLCMGLNKMFVYDSGEYGDMKNAYVGGDAYNFVINAGYSTAFFVLATGLLLAGLVCIGLGYSKDKLDEIAIQTQILREIKGETITSNERSQVVIEQLKRTEKTISTINNVNQEQ